MYSILTRKFHAIKTTVATSVKETDKKKSLC